MATCVVCPETLGRKNKSGYCIRCWPKNAWRVIREMDPDIERKRVDGIRRRYACDPEYKERAAETMRRISRLPQATEARRKTANALRFWEKGNAACPAGSPARKRAAARMVETKLADIPRELREEYKRLVRNGHIPAAQAKAIILEQHEKDMREFRRSIGA